MRTRRVRVSTFAHKYILKKKNLTYLVRNETKYTRQMCEMKISIAGEGTEENVRIHIMKISVFGEFGDGHKLLGKY
jgi:hypothetical protein